MDGASSPFFSFLHSDKIIHFMCYFILSMLLFMYSIANIWGRESSKIRFVFVFGIALFVGLCLEIVQANFTADRSGEWADLLMNILGSVFAIFILESLNYKSVLLHTRDVSAFVL